MTTTTTKVRYDGSACLNVRSVTAACKLLSNADSSTEPLRWSDLMSVLWFVETCVTSRKLFFDGTVPRSTIEQALEDVGAFKQRHDLKLFEVAAISFDDPYDILEAARDALAESRLLYENFDLAPEVDKPLDQKEHERFLQEFERVRSMPEGQRHDVALSWVADAFRGSKCLAGIVENGPAALHIARRLYELHGSDQGPVVTSALINRFRLNYVNHLASQKLSAYIPDPGFEDVTKQHVRLFKDYLLEQIVEMLATDPDASSVLIENMRAETPLPPIGLYALMATKVRKRPGALLEVAYNQFRQDDSLMRVIWRNTRGGIAVTKKDGVVDAASEIEQYFYDHFKVLEKEAKDIKPLASSGRTARTYLVPAVLKGLVKAIPEVLGVGKIWDVLYSVLRETGVESLPFLSDRLLGEGCDSYISQYKSLKWNLGDDPAIKTSLARLSDQVRNVFGRELVMH